MNMPNFITLETIMLVISMAVFVGIILYAYAPKRRASFQEQAMLAFQEQQPDGGNHG